VFSYNRDNNSLTAALQNPIPPTRRYGIIASFDSNIMTKNKFREFNIQLQKLKLKISLKRFILQSHKTIGGFPCVF